MAHPIFKEPRTLVENIIPCYATRPTNGLTPPELHTDDLLGCNECANEPVNLQVISQRHIEVDLYLTLASIIVHFS
jgi:hypothetical protein